MNRKYPPINNHLLNHLIIKKFETKVEFAKLIDVERNFVYNWCDGHCAPSPENLIKIADALETIPETFYIAGMEYVQMGVESALTRWAVEQMTTEAPSFTANEAIQYIKTSQPEIVEEADFESKESTFEVPGPSDTHQGTE